MTFWRNLKALFVAGNDLVMQNGQTGGFLAPGTARIPIPSLPPDPVRLESLRLAKTNGRAFIALLRETRGATLLVVLLSFLWALLNTASPVLLFRFLEDLKSVSRVNAAGMAAGYALAFLSVSLTVGFITNVIEWYKFHYSQTLSIGLSNALFAHAMRLEAGCLQGMDTGSLLSRLSLDTKTLALYLGEVSLGAFNLFSFVLGNLFLYRILGVLGPVSVALLLIPFPLLRSLSSGFYKHEMGAAQHRDARIGLLSSALNQIRMIKAIGLEDLAREEISRPRAREMAERHEYVGNLARFLFTTTALNSLVVVATFALFLAQGHVLTPAIAFSTLAMLRVIRRVVETIPLCVGGFSQRLLALQRIREFWALETRENA